MIEIPTFRITQGVAATYTYRWTGKNLTGHTGAAAIKDEFGGDLIDTATCILTALGDITFSVTAAESLLFPALEKSGYFPTAVMQLTVSGPTNNEVFQGVVAVAAAL
jgi:hypothetical protein